MILIHWKEPTHNNFTHKSNFIMACKMGFTIRDILKQNIIKSIKSI